MTARTPASLRILEMDFLILAIFKLNPGTALLAENSHWPEQAGREQR
jgi:hypothetical protein